MLSAETEAHLAHLDSLKVEAQRIADKSNRDKARHEVIVRRHARLQRSALCASPEQVRRMTAIGQRMVKAGAAIVETMREDHDRITEIAAEVRHLTGNAG